ncbi:MAG: glycosyltransferase [Bacteroidia bacterium]
MKVCLIGNNGSVHVEKWVKAIAGFEDIQLHVISFDKGVHFPGVTYHALKKQTGTKLDYLLNASLTKKLIRVIDPDILHAHYATSYGLLGALSGFHPYIVTGWGADIFDSPRYTMMRMLLKYTLKKADAITVLSEFTQKEIGRYTDKHIELIPFGVELSKFYRNKTTTDEFLRIGTIRTLSEKYGVEYLIRAFASLHERYPHVRLEIVGDGPQREILEHLGSELGVKEKIHFYGYVNQHTEPEKYLSLLNGFDIFAILSVIDSETFGVAAVEASACEIPVVATNIGGLPEVISDHQTGLLVPPRNSEETAKTLALLIGDATLRKTLGKNGRLRAETKYDWDKNVAVMIGLYRNLIKSSSN